MSKERPDNGKRDAFRRKVVLGAMIGLAPLAAGCSCDKDVETVMPTDNVTDNLSKKAGNIVIESDNVTLDPSLAALNEAVEEAFAKRAEEVSANQSAIAAEAAANRAEAAANRAEAAADRTTAATEVYPSSDYDVYTPIVESAKYGDFFSVRLNPTTKRYDLVDARTDQTVDIGSHMVQPISNMLTGIGNTKKISYSLNPGEAAVEQGYNVNGEYGVFQIRANRTDQTMRYSPTIGDGAVTIVPIANVAAHEADALNRAVANNWARNNVRGEVK